MSREIPIRRIRPSDKFVHLHWLYKQGPPALRGVTRAISLCGKKDIPRERVTAHLTDTTCPTCKEKAK